MAARSPTVALTWARASRIWGTCPSVSSAATRHFAAALRFATQTSLTISQHEPRFATPTSLEDEIERNEIETAVAENAQFRGLYGVVGGLLAILAALRNAAWGPFEHQRAFFVGRDRARRG